MQHKPLDSPSFAPKDPSDRTLDGLSQLGIRAKSTLDLLGKLEKGFAFRSFERLQEAILLSTAELAEVVQISERTLVRRKQSKRLEPDESDRLLRTARLFQHTIDLFEGNTEAAREWISTPKASLAGHTPLEFARTEAGSREVEAVIGQLEYGVFS